MRRLAALSGLALALAAAFPAGGRAAPSGAPRSVADLPPESPEGGRGARIALLPAHNLTSRALDEAAVALRLELALAREGIEVVSGDAVESFLASRRIRHTGGLDRADATAAGRELGVRGVLVTSVVQRDGGSPPRVAVVVRLVSVDDDPTLYWTDGVALSGEDHRGLLELRIEHQLDPVERRAYARLARSLARFLDGDAPAARRCRAGSKYRPAVSFRNALPPRDRAVSVAILPFVNRTKRELAGDVVALQAARALASVPGFRILEPGVVRAEVLRRRLVMKEGMSADTVRLLRGGLGVDYVLAGTVTRYDEARGMNGVPSVDVTVTMLDTATGRAVWHSRSAASGRDGVFLFDLGTIRNTEELTCRMLGEMAARLGSARQRSPRADLPKTGGAANGASVSLNARGDG